jgi:hypothetical protein
MMSRYRIYIIEVMPRWYPTVAPNVRPGKCCFYVGQTGKDVAERYREHRRGPRWDRRPKRPVEVFRKIRAAKGGADLVNKDDLKLRRTMFEPYPVLSTQAEAEKREAEIVDQLRLEGHVVYPRGLGKLPFRPDEDS